MAVISGKNGNVAWTGMVVNTYEWTLDLEADIFPATTFDNTQFKRKVAGMLDWSGTVAHRLDDTVCADWPGNSAALTLTQDTGNTYSGTAILAANRLTVQKEGEALGVVDFAGNSDLLITPSPSPETPS